MANLSGLTPLGDQLRYIEQVAIANGISPSTLYGVYGAESNYGQNEGPSTAGAEGPFQFLPSTGALFGLNSSTITNFEDSAAAAAKYLASLGANSSPTSPQTFAALNAYNGNRGGSSQTSYVQDVLNHEPSQAALNVAQSGLQPGLGGTIQGGINAASGAVNSVSDIPGAITGVFNSFTNWFPKALVFLALIGLAAGLILTAFHRSGGQLPRVAPVPV